ncbi:MAG: hypothetical protein ACK4RK_12500 [Gemmataceae bacterium]
MRAYVSIALILLWGGAVLADNPVDLFYRGQGIELNQAIPANERGVLCLTTDGQGRIFGGTTGHAAHLFSHDEKTGAARSLARLEGGIGLSYNLIQLPDGSLITGTQADPTGIATRTDPKAVGHLYRFTLSGNGAAKIEDLGVPVPGQGIYTIAYVEKSGEIAGNTWPDGHFFTYDLKAKTFKDHGAIAGYRTFETPFYAEKVNFGTNRNVHYPRQVSRAIVIDPATGAAYTAGATDPRREGRTHSGNLYRYDPESRTLEKLDLTLPAIPSREPWTSLDAAVAYPCQSGKKGDYTCIVGGTSDGYLFELRLYKDGPVLRPRGKPFNQGTIQALVALPPEKDEEGSLSHTVVGVCGNAEGMPRSFVFQQGNSSSGIWPGPVPRVDGQPSMNGIGAMLYDGKGNVYAGERDRIARLIRFPLVPPTPQKATPRKRPAPAEDVKVEPVRPLDCHIVFAPLGSTTEASGYTAIEVGQDGQVYVGSARYGGYGWLLRFDPTKKPTFMDKVVSLRDLSGERLEGINTQGKIHSKILVGADGKIWFASKQAHEAFGDRPEYAEQPQGYPGGHMCYFDPKTGFARSLGILKPQEGLVAGAIDDARGKVYWRSEPKNHFIVYDLKTGAVRDAGHVGNQCRYYAIDAKGYVYTTGRGDTLCRYNPETGYVEDLAVKMANDGGYRSPYVLAMGPNGKLYGAGFGHPYILEYDVDQVKSGPFPTVTVRNAAPAAPAGLPVLDIHAGVFGKDGQFYYPLNTSVPGARNGKPAAIPQLRIMRFDPKTHNVETAGVPNIVGLDEEKVKHTYNRTDKYSLDYMQGAAVSADGSLFLLDIYPQLNVACFPQLTAPRK